jgi:RNA polymerase sigma factor (sigma-70 family)
MTFFRDNPQLVEAFREGRHDVLELVYRAHVRALERYLHTLGRATSGRELLQPSSLADLLQEIFSRAFSPSARQSYDGVREYGPYLNAIARNCFVDALRARGREVLVAREDLPIELDDTATEPDPPRDPRLRALLSTYIEELSPALAAVYEQRFVLGRSQEEVCAAIGLSRRQLRTSEERLRKGLRKALLHAGMLREREEHGPAKIFRPSQR